MARKELDTLGLKCPQPILRIAAMMRQMEEGDILEVKADCDTFEVDVRKWCERMGKVLVVIRKEGDATIAEIIF